MEDHVYHSVMKNLEKDSSGMGHRILFLNDKMFSGSYITMIKSKALRVSICNHLQ